MTGAQATFQLEILGVKKNPQSTVYTSLGVITKGTVIEVNVSELGLVTNTGKVVWGTLQRQLLPHRVDFAHGCRFLFTRLARLATITARRYTRT